MKIVKIVLTILLSIVGIVLITALFVKKEYTIEREIAISQPKQVVFDYIKIVRNSENYSKWVMTDPNMKKEFRGTDGTIGFVYAWDSENKNVGKGEQTISNIVEGERIVYDLRFIKPFEGIATAYMNTDSISENETKVKWGFNSSMPYPMNAMLLFMNMEEMLGKDLEIGLANLKTILEK